MPALTAPRPRRLDSLQRSAIGKPKSALQRPKPKDQCCDKPQIEDDGEIKACLNCGKLIEESNIVADVTFSEDSRGAATVQGGFVGENARHARTLNTSALRRLGGNERNSIAEIEANGRRVLNALCPSLNISDSVQTQAANIWGLSARINFNAGRKTDEVVAACLYAACRRQPRNEKLMIDISEKINTGPFRLGAVYKDLCRTLYLGGEEISGLNQVEIEPLIMKYCRQLEFGEMTRQVAEDAVKIVRRMDRDWMTSGRHPAGLCGACIILAARMNNFRRSVREVVWVSKVADVTIMKRIEEFRRTKSASMTVEDFRKYGERLRYQHDPPSFGANELQKEKLATKKRKRQERHDASCEGSESASMVSSPVPSTVAAACETSLDQPLVGTKRRWGATESEVIEIGDDDDTDNDNDGSRASSAEPISYAEDTTDPTNKRQKGVTDQAVSHEQPRRDNDGFLIPPLPSTSREPVESFTKGKPGRPRTKNDPPEPMKFTLEELLTEEELHQEIEHQLSDHPVMQIVESEIERAERRAKEISAHQRRIEAEAEASRRALDGRDPPLNHDNNSREMITAEELEAEFADDDEVNNCILNDAEARVKEQIWVAHNESWLRQQYEKDLIKRIEESRGEKHKPRKGAAAKAGKKKRARMGDGSLLNEATTPIDSPADAARAMLDKHADRNFSKFVDYDVIERIFGDRRSSMSGASTPSHVVRDEDDDDDGQADAVSQKLAPRPLTAVMSAPPAEHEEQNEELDDPTSPDAGSQWGGAGDGDDDDERYQGEYLEGGEDEDDYNAALNEVGGASFGTYDEYDEYE